VSEAEFLTATGAWNERFATRDLLVLIQKISAGSASLRDRTANQVLHSEHPGLPISIAFEFRDRVDKLLSQVSELQGLFSETPRELGKGEPARIPSESEQDRHPPVHLLEGGESHGEKDRIETLAENGIIQPGRQNQKEEILFEESPGAEDTRIRQDRPALHPGDTPSPAGAEVADQPGSVGSEPVALPRSQRTQL